MKLRSHSVTRLFLLPLAILVFLAASETSKKQEKYVSPDQALCITITSTFLEGIPEAAETRVEIQPNKKRKFFNASTGEFPDAVQKHAVVKAGWTPDSQFFVFSLSSEGRPQAWHFATFFYDRKRNEIRSLDTFIGAISNAEFTLLPPEIVQTEIWNGGERKLGQVHLSKLDEAKRK
jgi:hypothetical protein